MANFFTNQLAAWTFKQKVSSVKQGVNDVFGRSDDTISLEPEADVSYNKDEHASTYAKRATAAHSASKQNVKSDAVKAAMERRTAAQAAAARKSKN